MNCDGSLFLLIVMLFQLPYYIDGDIKITQSNAVSVKIMVWCGIVYCLVYNVIAYVVIICDNVNKSAIFEVKLYKCS